MKKIFTLASLLAASMGFAQAGAPAPYYNGFNWNLTGMSLKTALSTKVTDTHTRNLTYQQAENAIKVVDLDPADASNNYVFLLYGFSNNVCPASTADDNDHRRRLKNSDGGGVTCEWNREHTYAKSLGNPDLGESGPGADAHHLRAADVQRNGARGSRKFATGSGNSGAVGSNWYPGDEWKGDVARMMMYMYVRYGSRCLPKNVAVGTTNSVDANMINLLLQWNAEDPVSAYEDQRNTYLGTTANTYGQGNRNPFIDNPYLATVIWGGPAAENRWPGTILANETFAQLQGVSIYPNPTRDQRVEIDSDVALDAIELINLNGQIIQKINNPHMDNRHYTLENLPQGFYLIRLSAQDQSTTKKLMVN